MNKSTSIINLNYSQYGSTPLFLGENPGLVDTINKQYPTLWTLYKKLKALDWDENEFNFSSCKREFQICDKNTYDIMIKTLAWQWEADSVVSRSVTGIGANLTSSSEMWALWQRIGENESLHSFTYSEIVRTSFDNPDTILQEILKVKEAHSRLDPLVEVLEKTYTLSHKLALGLVSKDDPDVYDSVILYMTAMYVLERIQFIGSFAVTFAVAETGQFMPIGKAVQKICQDEYEIHSRADLEILRIEKSTTRGYNALERLKPEIKKIVDTTIEAEKEWCNYILSEDREFPGLTSEKLFLFVLYCSKEVYDFFDINCDYIFPEKNPLKYVEKWIDMGKMQSSPQEEKPANYMLGMVEHDVSDETLDFNL
jgi:ribonucleoside-diphosphate reductase beta chain